MARRNKEKTIYDEDSTLVIQKTDDFYNDDISDTNIKIGQNTPKYNKQINVTDALDTIAGYIMPTFYMITDSTEAGECMLCGQKTAYKMRKICTDCMKEHSRNLYEKARAAIENGETTIQL